MKKILLAVLLTSLVLAQRNIVFANENVNVTQMKSSSETSIKDGIYSIESVDGSMGVDLEEDTVYLNQSSFSDAEKWTIKKEKDNTYVIYSFVTGQCLSVSKKSNIKKAKVILTKYNNKDTQKWKLRTNSKGNYCLQSVIDENYALSFGETALMKDINSKEVGYFSISKIQDITDIDDISSSLESITVDKTSDEKGNFNVSIVGIETTGNPSSVILEVTPKSNKDKAQTIYYPIEGAEALNIPVCAKDFDYESGNYTVKCSILIDGLYVSEVGSYTCKVEDAFGNLKKKIEDYIAENTNSWEDWQVYLRDLEHDKEFDVNSHPAQSASMIKMWVMGKVYEDYDRLCETYGKDTIDYYLYYMISWSYNWGWMGLTECLGDGDYVKGTEMVNDWAHENGYNDVTTKYEDSNNACSTKDASQFFKDVYYGKYEHSEDMMSLFLQQMGYFKIPAAMPPGIVTANKTGDLNSTENDTCLVYAPEGDIIISIMSTGLEGNTESARANIRIMARMIYDFLNE